MTETQSEPQASKSKSPLLIGIAILAVLAFVGFMMMNRGNSEEQMIATSEQEATTVPTGSNGEAMGETSNVKEITITASNFKYDLTEIRVKKGDTVRIVLKNAQGFHDWKVDEFNAQTKQIQADQEDTIEFVADQAGTFEFYCSVGNHRAMGMVGNLIVEE